jgi:hypothetical protein
MNTQNTFTQEQFNETAAFESFRNNALTIEELLLIKGGEGDDANNNGSSENKQDDPFN